jgi:predicted membrane-bound spermidine synthase
MKQLIMLAVIIIAFASCSESRSGNRESLTVARVRVINDSTVNWIRLSTVESKVYRVGDTLKMNPKIHNISSLDDSYYKLVTIDSILNK